MDESMTMGRVVRGWSQGVASVERNIAYWECEVLKMEVRVQQVKRTGTLSYAEAVKEVESGKGQRARREEIQSKEKKKEDEKREWVKKKFSLRVS